LEHTLRVRATRIDRETRRQGDKEIRR